MDAPATAVFLEDIAEHLERREYCYHAIDEGIHKLIEQEDDKFFPTMKTLLKYIHPIHWQLKRRINTLERALQRGHKAIGHNGPDKRLLDPDAPEYDPAKYYAELRLSGIKEERKEI